MKVAIDTHKILYIVFISTQSLYCTWRHQLCISHTPYLHVERTHDQAKCTHCIVATSNRDTSASSPAEVLINDLKKVSDWPGRYTPTVVTSQPYGTALYEWVKPKDFLTIHIQLQHTIALEHREQFCGSQLIGQSTSKWLLQKVLLSELTDHYGTLIP